MTGAFVSPHSVRRRARVGVAALAVRSSAQLVLSFAAMLILAGLMKPADFGVFAIIQFAVTLLSLFGDAGFGPALIRQKTAPTQREFATVWWAQMGLAVLVVAALLFCSTVMRGIWTDLPPVSESLLRAMSLSFLLNTLRVMPTIQLERELRFVSLAIVELLASVAYFGTAVGFAYFTRDVSALVYAVIAQSLVACTLAYVLRPWRPTFEFDWTILRSVARYGLAYQGNLLVGFANNAVTPLLVGIVLGKVALGLNGFAQSLAWLPLRLVEIFGRVGFPLYSAMRDDRAELAKEMRFNVQVCGLVTALFSCLLLVLGGPLLELAYGAKWQPAIPLLNIYATVILLGFLSPIASAMFYALGRPGLVFRLALGWTALNWAMVGIALYVRPSLELYALAYCVHVVVGNVAVLLLLRRLLPHVGIERRLVLSGLATVFIGLVGQRVLAHEQDFWTLVLGGVMSCTALAALLIAFDPSLIRTMRSIFGMRRS